MVQVMSLADAHITMTVKRRNLTAKTMEAYSIPVNECMQQIYPHELGRHELPCCTYFTHGACRPVHYCEGMPGSVDVLTCVFMGCHSSASFAITCGW